MKVLGEVGSALQMPGIMISILKEKSRQAIEKAGLGELWGNVRADAPCTWNTSPSLSSQAEPGFPGPMLTPEK